MNNFDKNIKILLNFIKEINDNLIKIYATRFHLF
jgi:hypothetical protein